MVASPFSYFEAMQYHQINSISICYATTNLVDCQTNVFFQVDSIICKVFGGCHFDFENWGRYLIYFKSFVNIKRTFFFYFNRSKDYVLDDSPFSCFPQSLILKLLLVYLFSLVFCIDFKSFLCQIGHFLLPINKIASLYSSKLLSKNF